MKERIIEDIARGAVSLDAALEAVLIGFKRFYGVENLYFYKALPKSITTDFSYASFDWMTSGNDPEFGNVWYATTDASKYKYEIGRGVEALREVLEGRESIYFDDTNKQYRNIDELKHDYFALKLSGVCP